MSKEIVVTVAVMLPPTLVEYLDQIALEQDLNRSQVVRKIIREYQTKKESESNNERRDR